MWKLTRLAFASFLAAPLLFAAAASAAAQTSVRIGYMPIAGEEFVYEMTLKCLLLPGANGFPTWMSEQDGEREMMKLPEQFRDMFGGAKRPQLTEEIGEQLATWGAGTSVAAKAAPPSVDELLASYTTCTDPATLRSLEQARGAMWSATSKPDKERLKTASKETSERIEKTHRELEAAANAPPAVDPDADLDAPAGTVAA